MKWGGGEVRSELGDFVGGETRKISGAIEKNMSEICDSIGGSFPMDDFGGAAGESFLSEAFLGMQTMMRENVLDGVFI